MEHANQLEEYKLREVARIALGFGQADLEKLGEVRYEVVRKNIESAPVMGSSGMEVKRLALEILGKRYQSLDELKKDLERLESALDFYLNWD